MQLDMFGALGMPLTPQVARKYNHYVKGGGRIGSLEAWLRFFGPLSSRGVEGGGK